MGANFFDFPVLGSLTVGVLISVNVLVVRYLMMYQRETRDEYARRLTRAVIELEVQKTVNVKLECQLELLKAGNVVKISSGNAIPNDSSTKE